MGTISAWEKKTLQINPLAGKPATKPMLVNVPELISTYYTVLSNVEQQTERVTFGTSGHRGSSLLGSFNGSSEITVPEDKLRG